MLHMLRSSWLRVRTHKKQKPHLPYWQLPEVSQPLSPAARNLGPQEYAPSKSVGLPLPKARVGMCCALMQADPSWASQRLSQGLGRMKEPVSAGTSMNRCIYDFWEVDIQTNGRCGH